MNVTLLDYGAGNVTSVERALHRLGVGSSRASTPETIASAEVLLLPGVGHYATLIRALDERAHEGRAGHRVGAVEGGGRHAGGAAEYR